MPRIQKRATRQRREWNAGHRTQLETGHDFFGFAWGGFERRPPDDLAVWPTREIEIEMRQSWGDIGHEIMADFADTIRRPWAWWWIVQGRPLRVPMFDSRDEEAHELDRLGLLTDAALANAAADPSVTHGVKNEYHEPAFRRRWGWWRWMAPERRDYDELEAVQLVDIDRRGGDVLTNRERHIAKHKTDPAAGSCAARVYLPRVECDALGLPDSFIDPYEMEN